MAPRACRTLAFCGAVALLSSSWYHDCGASAQVCRADGGGDGACEGMSPTVGAPFGEAALWAAAAVPAPCDTQTEQCNWAGTADAWRYALNNLRLAIETARPEDKAWLPLDQVKQVQGLVGQLGEQPGMWYGNWPGLAGFARELLEQLKPWLSSVAPGKIPAPRTNIGTKFPTLGRSVTVPTDGDRGSTVTLANGFALPVLGFGVWQIPSDGTTYRTVRWALELGYRHIDTAQGYGNEAEVGRAIRDSGLMRSEICVVTKLSDFNQFPRARQVFESQLQILGLDYIDVYMLHSPGNSMEGRRQAWKQLEELYDKGKIKALGLSNFDVPLLQELLGFARIRPVYLQNKYSIYQPGGRDEALKGESLMEWLMRESIIMTGYSIIHPGHGGHLSPLEDPHVIAIAKRHGRTASQVLHRWLLQLGAVVIPRSTKRERIEENGNLFEFALSEPDMRMLNGIASLLKSTPGAKAPSWCDDVYGLQGL